MTTERLDKTCVHFLKVTDVITGEITCGNCGVVLFEKAIDFVPKRSLSLIYVIMMLTKLIFEK